ncbi:MAG: hypothetical protein LQ347_004461 [Umbilicaria vellea]|nr:MAG: hypothetical protein LQ347_004461 [Umbilicaria vellea]
MTDSRFRVPRWHAAYAPASEPALDPVDMTSLAGVLSGVAGRNNPTIVPTSSIRLLEPASLHNVVMEEGYLVRDVIQRLLRLRSDAVAVIDILDRASWTDYLEVVDAAGAPSSSHQPCAILEEIETTITQVVRLEYPQIPYTLHRAHAPPEFIPRVDNMSLMTPRSSSLVYAIELVNNTWTDLLGPETLSTVLEGLTLHDQARFCHYLRNLGYATLVYQGEWDARLYFRMMIEGRPVEILLHYSDQEAPWPVPL